MKPCAICNAENQDSAVTCAACGEASFGAAVSVEPKKADPEPQQPRQQSRKSR